MIGELTNHLWQTTVFAVAAGLVAAALRKNRAQIRYGLWLSASLKFLVPFSLLMSLGGHLGWAPAAKKIATQGVSFAVVQIAQPFPDTLPFARSAPRATNWLPFAVLGVWLCGFAAIALIRLRDWLRIRAIVRASTSLKIQALQTPAEIDVRSAPGLLEPGVVGLLRPVLLLPEGILEHLTPPQLEAVLAHEMCHVRRRDNLTSAIHMIVEAAFWFHPFVWWIGARLVEERERACDEEVLRRGSEPHVYAESILRVCKFYVESPLTCVSGVTGSDLKKRVERIMRNHVGETLNGGRKFLLATAVVASLAVPIVAGALAAPRLRAQTPAPQSLEAMEAAGKKMAFDVASVKPNKSLARGNSNVSLLPGVASPPTGGLFSATNMPAIAYITFAYKLTSSQFVQLQPQLPKWATADRFDIEARAQGNPSGDQMRLMMQSLLADRFKLAVHTETKQGPIFALVLANPGKTGPQLKTHANDASCSAAPTAPLVPGAAPPAPPSAPSSTSGAQLPPMPCGTISSLPASAPGRRRLGGSNVTIRLIAIYLSVPLTGVDRPVIDRTGISGNLDFSIEFTPEGPPGPNFQPDATGPTFLEALQEQLGLKLEPQTGPIGVLVVDHIEEPSPN